MGGQICGCCMVMYMCLHISQACMCVSLRECVHALARAYMCAFGSMCKCVSQTSELYTVTKTANIC